MWLRNIKRIMRPAKFWIDGTTYNIGKDPRNAQHFKIDTTAGKSITKFHLPSVYYDKIYTDPKFSLSTVRKSNSTEILLPKKGKEGDITIIGDNIAEVIECREELHSMIQLIRENISPRQFIAIPTLSTEIKDNFIKFQEQLLSRENPIKDFDISVFQKPEKLHITICVFALLDQLEIDEAVRLLEELKQSIVMPYFTDKEVKIRLKGINCMDRNLKKTNIMYANASIVDETDEFNLQSIGDKISEFFYENGFVKEMRDSVKIHVTLINTKYRKTASSPNKRWSKRIPIDATCIVDEFKDFDFGTCNFDTIHLSLMSQGKSLDGFYKPVSIVTLK